ncbi:MAG: hypothetical protein ABSD59_09825 [Terracidiphilus sp.]|jgi:hypothetical protein
MTEKRNWFKEFLEWAHHAYWVHEFLVSTGIATYAAKMVATHVNSLSQYGWPLGLIIAGLLMYVAEFIRASLGNPRGKSGEAIAATVQPNRPDNRLQIISAHYGVEGDHDADVAENFIKPRVHGHALAGWVGADLFGGFQPVIGREKRVKVRYSFDGIEATVERPEHALLVLPEDKFLKERIDILRNVLDSQVVITCLLPNDPRIEPSFFDGRRSPIGGVESLELKNRGDRTAYAIRICPIKLKNRTIIFPQIVESLPPTDFSQFYGDIGTKWGTDAQKQFIRALNEEWAAYPDYDTRREIYIPVRIDYEDDGGIRFECNFTLVYHGGRGWNQPADFKCVECRDVAYRRIPKGITQQ